MIPANHEARMFRTLQSLEGLATAEAFGECFFKAPVAAFTNRIVPKAPWRITDDGEMACGIVEVLDRHGFVDPFDLATTFAKRYEARPDRGYGPGAKSVLQSIAAGNGWQWAASTLFGGTGSQGNGGAMRVAPLGAYFAEDGPDEIVRQAAASAAVTHAHPDGQAGAVAVALATAWAFNNRATGKGGAELFDYVLAHTPNSATRAGIEEASKLPLTAAPIVAALKVGSGYRILSSDTVPFVIWCAARHLLDYEEGIWTTVLGLGDRDTTCAMVGGILGVAPGPTGVPSAWLSAREPLPFERVVQPDLTEDV